MQVGAPVRWPIGIGKTTFGAGGLVEIGFWFVDGDELSTPGHWLRLSLQISRKVVGARESAL